VIFTVLLFVLDYGLCAFLDKGLRRYFGFDRPVEVVFVGHSRTILGIDEELIEKITGLKASKFAVNGANTVDRAAMVRYFLKKQPGVRVVVYDVEESSFSDEGLSANSYRLFFPFIDDPDMADYLKKHCKSADEYWLRKIFRSSRYDEVTLWLSVRGWLGIKENLKLQKFDPALARRAIEKGSSRPAKVDVRQYDVFLNTVCFATARGVKVVLVNMPTVDIINRIDPSGREEVRNLFRDLAGGSAGGADCADGTLSFPHAPSGNPVFLDYSRTFETRYDLFYDTIHMNAKGQQVLTEEIARQLKSVK